MPYLNLPKRKTNYVKTVSKMAYQDIYQDKRWKLIRAEKLRVNPLCQECEKEKKVTIAEEVHHRIPFEWGRNPVEKEELAFDYDNTRSLCIKCHKEAHEKLKKQHPEVVLRIYFDKIS